MSVKKKLRGLPRDKLAAAGIMYHDSAAVTPCQQACMRRLGMTIQMEQEAYLSEHPEVGALLKRFIGKMAHENRRKDFLKAAGEHFTKPADELDADVRRILNLPPDAPYYTQKVIKPTYETDDMKSCLDDIKKIIESYYKTDVSSEFSTSQPSLFTLSSSFISEKSSKTTVPTPEPLPIPEPTLSETLFTMISNTVDKAIFQNVDDFALRYDTAYIELAKAVENAMEITVIEIREDIATLFSNAYNNFEIIIKDKERIAAEIAWEKRMRKKLKRLLRRQKNFKGYETPPTPKSVISSHESYKKPPARPCKCHPQFTYNRYPKDRYGIYLPKEGEKHDRNETVTPVFSTEDLRKVENKADEDNVDKKSMTSKLSKTSSISANRGDDLMQTETTSE